MLPPTVCAWFGICYQEILILQHTPMIVYYGHIVNCHAYSDSRVRVCVDTVCPVFTASSLVVSSRPRTALRAWVSSVRSPVPWVQWRDVLLSSHQYPLSPWSKNISLGCASSSCLCFSLCPEVSCTTGCLGRLHRAMWVSLSNKEISQVQYGIRWIGCSY